MRLIKEFEPISVSLINRTPSSTLDVCLQELRREEQRSCSHVLMEEHKTVSFGGLMEILDTALYASNTEK